MKWRKCLFRLFCWCCRISTSRTWCCTWWMIRFKNGWVEFWGGCWKTQMGFWRYWSFICTSMFLWLIPLPPAVCNTILLYWWYLKLFDSTLNWISIKTIFALLLFSVKLFQVKFIFWSWLLFMNLLLSSWQSWFVFIQNLFVGCWNLWSLFILILPLLKIIWLYFVVFIFKHHLSFWRRLFLITFAQILRWFFNKILICWYSIYLNNLDWGYNLNPLRQER